MPIVKIKDWGLIPYEVAWNRQKEYFNNVLQAKTENRECNYLVLCEHPHVYTLGKSGNEHNLLIDTIQLSTKEASFYKIDRGGDITYHGPGQIVGYPILNLDNWQMGVKEYIFRIEESIIQTLKQYDIYGQRIDGATGVWIDVGKTNVRKICAIGVKFSRYITMHGFAFNVNTNLDFFNYINPCGFRDKGVTSLAKELEYDVDIEEVKKILIANIAEQFNMKIE